MLPLLPMLPRATGWSLPRLPALSGTAAVAAAALLVVVGGAAWFASGAGFGRLAGVANLPLIGGKSLQGRAYPIGADTLRVGATTVKLTGIDAPEAEQRCGTARRGWRCGGGGGGGTVPARRRPHRRPVRWAPAEWRCRLGARTMRRSATRTSAPSWCARATCSPTAASWPLRQPGARGARCQGGPVGGGDVERPAAYRAKLWEEAKRRAPEGCPIKGQVAGSARTYVLPWSPDYERARVQKTRGERWFCSEQEAVSAGFKAAQRG